ncbi:unnamed protein product [Sphenostylis stenocarpa]|uniref:Uncharacterized protein n=1 Tax=Sphenostylis stenocarpa TaxID=92480 RepID=A0AA86SGG4_9FABA|nr:unnamed protein product [Sphenostylis stenocarpa]
MPAPVLGVVALAAPPPPYLSVVLLGMFDCESRCFGSKVLLSDELLYCSLILHTLAPQIAAKLLATPAPLLTTTCPQKSKNKNIFLRETLPEINQDTDANDAVKVLDLEST